MSFKDANQWLNCSSLACQRRKLETMTRSNWSTFGIIQSRRRANCTSWCIVMVSFTFTPIFRDFNPHGCKSPALVPLYENIIFPGCLTVSHDSDCLFHLRVKTPYGNDNRVKNVIYLIFFFAFDFIKLQDIQLDLSQAWEMLNKTGLDHWLQPLVHVDERQMERDYLSSTLTRE